MRYTHNGEARVAVEQWGNPDSALAVWRGESLGAGALAAVTNAADSAGSDSAGWDSAGWDSGVTAGLQITARDSVAIRSTRDPGFPSNTAMKVRHHRAL